MARHGFAWLVELASSESCAPLYLRGGEGADDSIGWTQDHNAARRFPSEAAGRAFAEEHIEGDVRVCEYGWP